MGLNSLKLEEKFFVCNTCQREFHWDSKNRAYCTRCGSYEVTRVADYEGLSLIARR